MNIQNIKSHSVRPIHPSEILREDFMPDYRLSVSNMAEALAVSRQSINELIRERRAFSPEMAIRLARLFGNTPAFWLNGKQEVDLWDANQAIKNSIKHIKPIKAA